MQLPDELNSKRQDPEDEYKTKMESSYISSFNFITHGHRFPRYVLNQLKIFVPVGKDIKIVTPEK